MTQQTILITGATSGIGREAALYLARRGHRVFATGRNPRALAELEREGKGLPLHPLRLDVTDADSIAAARDQVMERTEGHGLDALINNAGYGHAGPSALLESEQLRVQLETNVVGLMAVTRAFLPEMLDRGRGRIVNVSSIGGRITMPFMGAYHASKYAVEALSDALRLEVGPLGVDVVIVEPGAIKTAFGDRAVSEASAYQARAGRWAPLLARAEEIQAKFDARGADPIVIARVLERALTVRRPRARYVAPFSGRVLVFLVEWLPTRLADTLMRRFMGLSHPAMVSGPRAAAATS